MTDDELIEAMALEICEARTWAGAWDRANEVEREAWRWDARAALAVAKREIVERAAREAENECWEAEAHPESIYGSTCLKIAARIRSLADD